MSTIDEALAALRRGEVVIVVDDEGEHEGKGDLVVAAELATAEAVNFMATHGRGLICVPMLRERLSELGIPPMASRNAGSKGTAFHVGVDLERDTTSGISARARALTIRTLADPASVKSHFRQPGHVFPLGAQEGGVLRARGHIEAAVDLAALAGLAPAAVTCGIADDDGEAERLPGLVVLAERHGLQILAMSDLIAHRLRAERLVARAGSASLPLPQGDFTIVGYEGLADGREHLALVLGRVSRERGVLVRVHSECLMGDAFGSLRCDCGAELDLALSLIAREGCGVLVYVRGDAERRMGLSPRDADRRGGGIEAQILRDLGVRDLRVLSNDPTTQTGLEAHGLRVTRRIPLVAAAAA